MKDTVDFHDLLKSQWWGFPYTSLYYSQKIASLKSSECLGRATFVYIAMKSNVNGIFCCNLHDRVEKIAQGESIIQLLQ